MLILLRPHRGSRLCAALFACLYLLITAVPITAQDFDLPKNAHAEPDRWLSDSTWKELRYGMTVREPHDAIRVPDTPQGDVMRWAMKDGTRISLSFARGYYEAVHKGPDGRAYTELMPAKIDLIKKQIGDEMLLATSGQVFNTRTDQLVDTGQLVGVINYFIIKPDGPNASAYFYGTALLQLDQASVALIKLECKPENIVSAVCTFESLVHSIKVQEAKDVNRQLHGWLVNGQTLLDHLTQEDRLKAMRDDRLYRVLDDGKDLGYMRAWQRYQDADYYKQLKENAKIDGGTGELKGIDRFQAKGNALIIQAHLEGRGSAIERLYEAVDTVGEDASYWQIKNTMKTKNKRVNRFTGMWVETGLRGVSMIGDKRRDYLQVTREGTPPKNLVNFVIAREEDEERRLRFPSAIEKKLPAGDLKELKFETPKIAFLSFVDAALMPAMLPREEKTYAFTAYDAETSRVDIRLMRVVPNPDGGKTVFLRPVLDRSEQTLVFDRNNELIVWSFPDGREMRQTTRQELARIWGVRLRD